MGPEQRKAEFVESTGGERLAVSHSSVTNVDWQSTTNFIDLFIGSYHIGSFFYERIRGTIHCPKEVYCT